jgi:hypothetical protein
MAVIMKQTMPADVPIRMLDAVTEDPPRGLIVHTHYERNGQVHILDVWDSEESYRTFADQRLMPAVAKIATQNGIEPQPPEEEIIQVHDYVAGKG